MVYRIIFVLLISGYPIAFTGTQHNNNPTPETNNSHTGFPTLQVSGVQNLAATPPENQQEEVVEDENPLSRSQLFMIKKIEEVVKMNEKAILIKTVAICAMGAGTIFAVTKLF